MEQNYKNNLEDFFCFTLLQPLMASKGYPLGKVIGEIYDLDSYPFLMINNPDTELFRLSQEGAPQGFVVETVIFSLRFNKQFLA